MNDSYFVVHMKDGSTIDFNTECKYIKNFGDLEILRFITDDKENIVLGLIPIENILWIECIT